MGRTIIIGDLHGMHSEAVQLLNKCNATYDDHVVFLGDLVDRGPDSAGCVDLAMRIESRQGKPACILANHEEKHLFYDDIEQVKGSVTVNAPTHVATRLQLTRRHYDYFRSLSMYLNIPEHNIICVHAGVYPDRKIEQQIAKHLLHAQMIRPYDNFGNRTNDESTMWVSRVAKERPTSELWRFWTDFWKGPETIVFGHTVTNEPLIAENAIGIDGGGVFGRELWALVLPSREIIRVKCNVNNDPDGRDLATRGNAEKKTFPIAPGVFTW